MSLGGMLWHRTYENPAQTFDPKNGNWSLIRLALSGLCRLKGERERQTERDGARENKRQSEEERRSWRERDTERLRVREREKEIEKIDRERASESGRDKETERQID